MDLIEETYGGEVAAAMPRKRIWLWKGGKRIGAVTAYCVREPSTNVVAMKRA